MNLPFVLSFPQPWDWNESQHVCSIYKHKDLPNYPVLYNSFLYIAVLHTLKQCVERLSNCDFHQPVIITFSSCMLALIALDEQTNIIFGPITSVPLTYHQFYGINTLIEDLDDLLHLYKIIQCSPMMTLAQFASSVSLFIKLVFQEEISTKMMIYDNHEQENKIPKNTDRSQQDTSEMSISTLSTVISFQKSVLQDIKTGNCQGIEEAFESGMQIICNNITFTSSEDVQIFFLFSCINLLYCYHRTLWGTKERLRCI